MIGPEIGDLQESVRDKSAFGTLEHFSQICRAFLVFLSDRKPTRIISPTHESYIFFQYDEHHGHKISRPLNTNLFIESSRHFAQAFKRFRRFLDDIEAAHEQIAENPQAIEYLESKELSKVIYTIQQAIGCIGDSFDNQNQSRKRIGQLFETLIKLVIQEVGIDCEPRTINIPIPGQPGYKMSYQLDLVLSRNSAIIASETNLVHPSEVVGSVKTSSKDRIDKMFLDKFMLTKLLGRDIPVIAIFLNDVQRAKRGNSIFGINSTFKSNHFLGYTVALTRLDGVYYIDPRPDMLSNIRLREQIHGFEKFLANDLWLLTKDE